MILMSPLKVILFVGKLIFPVTSISLSNFKMVSVSFFKKFCYLSATMQNEFANLRFLNT